MTLKSRFSLPANVLKKLWAFYSSLFFSLKFFYSLYEFELHGSVVLLTWWFFFGLLSDTKHHWNRLKTGKFKICFNKQTLVQPCIRAFINDVVKMNEKLSSESVTHDNHVELLWWNQVRTLYYYLKFYIPMAVMNLFIFTNEEKPKMIFWHRTLKIYLFAYFI